jgi:hypothetical protein
MLRFIADRMIESTTDVSRDIPLTGSFLEPHSTLPDTCSHSLNWSL